MLNCSTAGVPPSPCIHILLVAPSQPKIADSLRRSKSASLCRVTATVHYHGQLAQQVCAVATCKPKISFLHLAKFIPLPHQRLFESWQLSVPELTASMQPALDQANLQASSLTLQEARAFHVCPSISCDQIWISPSSKQAATELEGIPRYGRQDTSRTTGPGPSTSSCCTLQVGCAPNAHGATGCGDHPSRCLGGGARSRTCRQGGWTGRGRPTERHRVPL